MKYKVRIFLLLTAMIFSQLAFSQQEKFKFIRPIHKVNDDWHKVELPDGIFGKVQNNLADLRIIGINGRDSIEVPYILNVAEDQIKTNEVESKLLNFSKKDNSYIFFLEVPSKEAINTIHLEFKEDNFDWKISLEGSHQQDDWYKILEDYRIVSVKNLLTDYSFTTLSFPPSNFKYYKVIVLADKRPNLVSAKIKEKQIVQGSYKKYPLETFSIIEDHKRKETNINISLPNVVPVSLISLEVIDNIDYYRPITIYYVTDSVNSGSGWKYKYRAVYSGVLSSLENTPFKFENTIASKFKITIRNHDNAPLHFEAPALEGNVHELIARFPEPGNYFLMYGNKKLYPPTYDLVNFKEKIPQHLVKLETGAEQVVFDEEIVKSNPLIENQWWLWLVMVVIIAVLGTFSLKMIKKVN